jgi:predicted MFS family arabinose efflux permease
MAAVLVWLRRAVPEPDAYEAPPPGEAHAPGPAASEAHAPTPAAGALPGRFWLYAAFTALTLAGYATFAVLAYHLHVRHVVSDDQIPLVYAAAMAAGALAALVSGRLYDRIGLRGLVVLPMLAAAVPFLSFSTTAVLVWVGAVIWGAAMGMHESTMQAAVADLAPAARRGSAYGSFTAVYGTAWLAGSAAIGALYGLSIEAATVFVVVIQALALIAFAPLLRPQPAPT